MKNLIDISNFTDGFQVYAGTDATQAFLSDVISRHQPEILRAILGEREYQAFNADFTNGSPVNEKWQSFLNGKTYTVNSISYYYLGIKPVLVRFIYYYWQRESATILSESGEIKRNYDKLKPVIPYRKMITAWNEAVDMVQNSDDYYPSVYHFLDNAYTFSNWEFKGFDKMIFC